MLLERAQGSCDEPYGVIVEERQNPATLEFQGFEI